ncbi:hypothetical protein LCGC14_1889590 [marine sediment metagenome]|uniref:Uncharacterized protein n=1 Tax=marine sediment metagenome TaxID=412755 RepID=A0A0F9G029_9ZZZZ
MPKMQRFNMPDPKYGFDILIVWMDEGTPRSPFEPLSFNGSACECGASEPVPSFQATPSIKAAILAVLELFPPVPCPTEKTVISVTGLNRCILN